jgi:Domain of unknown function (DUF5658)
MRRLLVASLMGVLMTASTTFAAGQDRSLSAGSAVSVAVAAPAPLTEAAANLPVVPRSLEPHRPMVLPALYGASAFLQGYDAYSTLKVLQHGGVEANPLMKSVTKNPAALIGLKAGVTALSIVAAERMWKSHNRVGAVVTMVVSNSLMAMVAANNARVLKQVQQ